MKGRKLPTKYIYEKEMMFPFTIMDLSQMIINPPRNVDIWNGGYYGSYQRLAEVWLSQKRDHNH